MTDIREGSFHTAFPVGCLFVVGYFVFRALVTFLALSVRLVGFLVTRTYLLVDSKLSMSHSMTVRTKAL
jgi:hypothetical protein